MRRDRPCITGIAKLQERGIDPAPNREGATQSFLGGRRRIQADDKFLAVETDCHVCASSTHQCSGSERVDTI